MEADDEVGSSETSECWRTNRHQGQKWWRFLQVWLRSLLNNHPEMEMKRKDSPSAASGV